MAFEPARSGLGGIARIWRSSRPPCPEQGEDLAGADLQIDVAQRNEPRFIGLAKAPDIDDRSHPRIVVQPQGGRRGYSRCRTTVSSSDASLDAVTL